MKKLLFLFLTLISCVLNAQLVNFVQSPAYSNFTPGGMQSGRFTKNKNHLLFVTDMSFQKGFLFKLNSMGDTTWTRELDAPLHDYDELSDGSVMGFIDNNDSLKVYKVQASGKLGWARKLMMPSGGQWNSTAVCSNNLQCAYAIGSNYWSSGIHILFGILDSAGQPVLNAHLDMSSWFGTNTYNVTPRFIRQTSTGDYIISGTTSANSGIPTYIFFIKLNSSGQLVWVRTYQTGTGNTSPTMGLTSMALTANDEILISGNRFSPAGTAYARLDANGNALWSKSISDNVYMTQITELSNGELALHVANSNQVTDAVNKNILAVLTPGGNLRVARSFGFNQNNNILATGCDAAGKVTATGLTGSFSSPVVTVYNMDTLGLSTGCYDVINSLPINTWTISTTAQTMNVTPIANLFVNPQASPGFQMLVCTKTYRNILTNGIVSDPLCHGQLGAVQITPTNGNSPFNYSWSNGTNSQNLLNVPGGVYTVRVSDATGCVVLDTFSVIEPSQLTTTYTVSHVTCFGAQNGSINVTTGGGTPGYTYQWTTQATTEDLTNLSGGFYQLTITDTNGCTKTLAVSVSEPQQLIAGIISSQNVTCHGVCNGSLTGIASGGTQPYTYQWNNPGNSTTTNITGLCPGNYLFSVTDSKNCFTFSNAVITEPAALAITSAVANAQCGAAYGEASVLVTGGVSPYTYAWSSGSANDTAVGLYAGTYTVSVNDANNCPISTTVNVGITTPVSELCMVTVDSLSSHNILMWDKTAFTNVAYFNIFREDITNNYTLIAAVNYDSLSEYHDYDTLMADPNITTKRYKISAMDTCGNESAKSNFHNTIFIAHNNGTFTWNTYTIQNSANPVTSYRLMRDDFSTGNWQQIGSTAGTQNVLNDPNYATFQTTADWRVETIWGISCTATMRQGESTEGAVVKSKSNITNNRVVGIATQADTKFAMYPNPAADVLTIVVSGQQNNSALEMSNALGEVVMKNALVEGSNPVDVTKLANGVYYVKISSDEKTSFVKKLIVQR